jgi:hypothetical protein
MKPLYYCIAHAPFPWRMPAFMTMLGSGDYVPESGLAMSQLLSPEEARRNRYLGEYLALFQVRRLLQQQQAQGMVGFCHYRRFALTVPIGTRRDFNHWAHPDDFARVLPEHFLGDGQTPIVPVRHRFAGSVLQQYCANAVARDILMFFGDAIDCGVISDWEASNFLSGDAFIPCPTVAYIPVPWFIEIAQQLELVMSRHYRYHYINRDGYLARSMAFSCERLHALLLARHIAALGEDKVVSTATVVLDDKFPRT